MDRQAWIAVTLCVLGLIGWQFYMAQHAPPVLPPPAPALVPDAAPSPTAAAAATPADPAAVAATDPATSDPAAAAELEADFVEKIEPLRNSDVELRLTTRGGGIVEAHLLNHAGDKGEGVVILNSPDRLPIGAILERPEATKLPEFTVARQVDGSVQFERLTPGGVTVRKRYFFPPTEAKRDNFVAEMQLEFRNDGAQPYRNPGYFLALGSTKPVHENDFPAYTRLVWYVGGKAKGIDVNWFPAQNYPLVGIEKRPAQEYYRETVTADWAGMSNQFFTTLVTPLDAKASEVWGRRFEMPGADGHTTLGVEGAMGMPAFEIAPGQTHALRLQIYAGPKLYNRLARLNHDEAAIMNFGMWKLVSEALLNFMNLLHGWVKDYGVAIILLTACVKGVLWPLQNKANRSMRKMSALAPKMQELREKFKDDPTKMNQEVMKLYKDHGVNPVGGCLPMLIQIPIFFGFFTMLGQAAELRNASFLWISDLSQPDTVAYLPGFNFPINLLPILMGASSFWLMRMTPNTGDAMQRRILMFMPLIFLIFCYNFAAALALYYTTQNLFTILQLWVNKRQPLPEIAKPPPPPTKRSRKGKS
ncbi:membrane protein insertase YidC [soil metagenome]